MFAHIRTVIVAGTAILFIGTGTAQARFLQVDPIGYQDQFNLYTYVRNDPLDHLDPTGRDAIVLVRANGNIDIILPMTFSGNAATSSNIAAAIHNIQSSWTGNFGGINVTTTVVNGTSAIDPTVQNTMVITSGNTSRTDPTNGTQGHSFVRDGRTGEVTLRDLSATPISQPGGGQTVGDKGANTYGHEGGHYMGAPDQPTPGLMGPGSSNAVTANDIAAIRQQNTPTGAINTVIECRNDDRC